MKILILLLVLLFPSFAYSAPSTTVSISPSAVDATTITASDENTRNSAISTWANVHDHNDIDQTANTLAVGDAAAGNKTITANNADSNKPFIRYDDTNDRWVSSRNGITIESLVVLTGAANGAFVYTPTKLRDADENTLIQVEESANENIVRIDTNGTERWIMTAAGERTMPTQPAFEVRPAGTQSNITAGGLVTIVMDSEIFDQGSDFATNTFTAPVTGRYQFSFLIYMGAVDTAAVYELRLVTSNRNYVFANAFETHCAIDCTYIKGGSVLADMDSGDTAYLDFIQTGGTNQTDIFSDSFFSGSLLF